MRAAWRGIGLGLILALAPQAAAPAAAQAPAPEHARLGTLNGALGVECTHCHTAERWADPSRPAFDLARRMMRMVEALNTGPLKRARGVTCWTCHRGAATPPRISREAWQAVQARWPAELADRPEVLKRTMSVYAASLGVGCDHCHVPGDWASNAKRPKTVAGQMAAMMAGMPRHFSDARMPVLQCYTCHQGTTSPR
ncbi:MAG: photosynthetic reaction center cytochrome c subunit family protein [Vicinamibacterales bacterium]|nr:photosynthetic reaction center cytochrome c subunit family protein [Vicinamibacterales bacterium]